MTAGPTLYPILFKPVLREKIWGGQAFRTKLAKDAPLTATLGESWEVSGFAGDVSVAANGAWAGKSLAEILFALKADLVGDVGQAEAFPLLYKFLDANDKLSVQVHPDDDQARRRGWGQFGKTEAWYIVDVNPGGQIIVGFKPGVAIDDVRKAVRADSLGDILNSIDIAAGDVLFVPAGTVHAILGGTLIYEVQESSDTTFRIYDWGRVEPGGKPRQLHVKESLSVLDTSFHTCHKIPPLACRDFYGGTHAFRVACRYFCLEEYRLDSRAQAPLPAKKSFRVVTLLDKSVVLKSAAGEMEIVKGQSALLPAAMREVSVEAPEGAHFLLSSVPDLQAEVVEPLLKQGFSEDDIALLGGNPRTNDLLEFLRS